MNALFSPGNPLPKALLPVEAVAMAAFAASLVISVGFSLRYYLPSAGAALFAWHHYLGPISFAGMFSFVSLLFTRGSSVPDALATLSRLCRNFLAFLLIVYLHFNLKLWAQLINPQLYDPLYYKLDRQFPLVIEALQFVSDICARLPLPTVNGYHDLFIMMFFVSFGIHALLNNNAIFERVLTATGLVLAIGGASYSIAPALGPFVYEPSQNPFAAQAQAAMLSFHQEFTESAGAAFREDHFVSALAAMPSLHIANAVVFTYFAVRYIPVLAVLYLPLCLYFIAEGVATRWHYLADIPAGLVVAALSIWLAGRLAKRKMATSDRGPKQKIGTQETSARQ